MCTRYNAASGDLSFFPSKAAWQSQLTAQAAQGYLREHFKGSLAAEFPIAHTAFQEAAGGVTGYWSLVRILFPAINFLGTLWSGSESSSNAVRFMVEYLGHRRADTRYVELSGLVYAMYRHGLVHTHMPKVFQRDDGQLVGWGVTFAADDHLKLWLSPTGRPCVVFCPAQFFEDLCRAIDLYIGGFDDPTKTADLLANFSAGFLENLTHGQNGPMSGR